MADVTGGGIGLALVTVGVLFFLLGQVFDTREKDRAKRLCLVPVVWLALWIPLTIGFNLLMGLLTGGAGLVSPFPEWVGNFWPLFLLFLGAYLGSAVAVQAARRK